MKLTAVTQIKNTALYEAVQKIGSQNALAKHLEVNASEIGKWIRLLAIPNLKIVRKLRPEKWQKIEDKLISLTGQFLEDIFPQELLGSDFLERPKVRETTIDVPIVSLLDAPKEFLQLPPMQEESMILEDEQKAFSEVLKSLTKREEKVIRARFGFDDGHEKSLSEIGEDYLGVSTERVRQIEAKALRKLRHPSRSNKLRRNREYSPDG